MASFVNRPLSATVAAKPQEPKPREEVRALDSLRTEDLCRLPPVAVGSLSIDADTFKTRKFAESFNDMLFLVEKKCNQKLGARGTMIELFLLEATSHIPPTDHIAVFPRHQLARPVTLSPGFAVQGPIDWVVSRAEHDNVELRRMCLLDGSEVPVSPRFCVVEATTGTLLDGETRMIAAMRMLQATAGGRAVIYGALTDAFRWQFYYLTSDGAGLCKTRMLKYNDHRQYIAKIISAFIEGGLPVGMSPIVS